jgi:protein gp37
MHPAWVRGLRDFAIKHGIAFHFKQWGHFAPQLNGRHAGSTFLFPDEVAMVSRSKALNGRTLDGRTHDEFPICLPRR